MLNQQFEVVCVTRFQQDKFQGKGINHDDITGTATLQMELTSNGHLPGVHLPVVTVELNGSTCYFRGVSTGLNACVMCLEVYNPNDKEYPYWCLYTTVQSKHAVGLASKERLHKEHHFSPRMVDRYRKLLVCKQN